MEISDKNEVGEWAREVEIFSHDEGIPAAAYKWWSLNKLFF